MSSYADIQKEIAEQKAKQAKGMSIASMDAINSFTRGYADKLLSAINPDATKKMQAEREAEKAKRGDAQKVVDILGTAVDSATNSALFGVPDVIAKSSGSDYYKKLQASREANKGADTAGSLAGMFAPTGGALFSAAGKGLGVASKAVPQLAKGADFLAKAGKLVNTGGKIGKLGQVGSGVARGALTSVEQILPRALTGNTDLGEAGLGVAIGAGLGGAGSAVSKYLPGIVRQLGIKNKGTSFVEPLSESLRDKELSSLGLSGLDFKRAINDTARTFGVNKTGSAINNAEGLKDRALSLMKKADILNADEAQDFIQGTGKKFEVMGKKWEDTGSRVSDFKDSIYSDPVVVQFIEDHGDEGVKKIEYFISGLDKKSNVNNIKTALNKESKFSNNATDNRLQFDFQDVIHSIKENLDDEILKLDPKYLEYKADWRDLQPLRYMVAKDKLGIPKSVGGSGTAEKAAMMEILSRIGGKGVGSGLGMATVAPLSGYDKDDPSTILPALGKIAAGGLAGSAINKYAPKLKNIAEGRLAGLINKPKILAGIEKGVSFAGKLPEPALQAAERFQAEQRARVEPKQAEKQISNDLQPEDLLVKAEQATDAKPINEKLMAKIDQKLQDVYAKRFADKMTYEDFYNEVSRQTDGFEPTKSARILYDDKKQRARFVRDYKAAQKVSGFSEAYKDGGFLEDKAIKNQKAFTKKDIADTIASLTTEDGKTPTAETSKRVQKDLDLILSLKLPDDQKKMILLKKLSDSYGLGLEDLQSVGLA